MSLFIKKYKTSYGKTHCSIVDGYRVNGKIKHKTIKNYGYLEDLEKKFDEPIEFLNSELDKLKKEFPNTSAYLDSYREELAKRDMDKSTDWFLFGRSQGIQNSGLKKIVLKNVIDKNKPKIEPFILDENVVVYSGRYITAKTEEDLQKAYNIFKSEEFARYCALVGKNKSGGYVEVSTKAVKEFGVDIEKQPSVES